MSKTLSKAKKKAKRTKAKNYNTKSKTVKQDAEVKLMLDIINKTESVLEMKDGRRIPLDQMSYTDIYVYMQDKAKVSPTMAETVDGMFEKIRARGVAMKIGTAMESTDPQAVEMVEEEMDRALARFIVESLKIQVWKLITDPTQARCLDVMRRSKKLGYKFEFNVPH